MGTTTAKHNQLKCRDVEPIHLYRAIPKNTAERRQKDCKETEVQGVFWRLSPRNIKSIHASPKTQTGTTKTICLLQKPATLILGPEKSNFAEAQDKNFKIASVTISKDFREDMHNNEDHEKDE